MDLSKPWAWWFFNTTGFRSRKAKTEIYSKLIKTGVSFCSISQAQTSCGFGAVCMTAGSGLPNFCKCQMGFVCGPDGGCRSAPEAEPAAPAQSEGAPKVRRFDKEFGYTS